MPPEVSGPNTASGNPQPPVMRATSFSPTTTRVNPLPPTPAPGPLESAAGTATRTHHKGMLTLAAIGGAIGLGIATVMFVQEPLTMGENAVLISIASVVAFLGLMPMRWGGYVWAMVTVAFFGLTIYNQLNPEGTIFQLYRGSSYTFAVIMPAIGIFVGGVVQGLYRIVGGR
jgi:hypothetical protein